MFFISKLQPESHLERAVYRFTPICKGKDMEQHGVKCLKTKRIISVAPMMACTIPLINQ